MNYFPFFVEMSGNMMSGNMKEENDRIETHLIGVGKKFERSKYKYLVIYFLFFFLFLYFLSRNSAENTACSYLQYRDIFHFFFILLQEYEGGRMILCES